MIYTVRFCHLESKSNLKGPVRRGDIIGTMGNTGQSTANHVHMDLVQGVMDDCYRLNNINMHIHNLHDLMEQYHYFLDSELFGGVDPVITSSFGDPTYIIDGQWKYHPAFDIVPENRHETKANYNIIWNRSIDGSVIANDFDPAYGNYVNIIYKVE